MSCNDDKTYEPCSCGCGGSSDCTCDYKECAPVNCIEQAIRDALATLQEQLEALVKRAEDAAKASEDAAAASAASAAEAKGYRDAAELAATTATKALKTITDVAVSLEETAKKLQEIADELATAIAGIAVVTWYYTAVSDGQTEISVPADKNALDVQCIYIEGARQEPGRGFVFDKTTMTITLTEGIPLGLEISIILGTYSDNPTDFPQTLASNNGASLVGTSSGNTVQEVLNSHSGSFQTGVKLLSSNDFIVDKSVTPNQLYRWDGALPKLVDPGSTPATSGGIGIGSWVSVGDETARQWVTENFIESPFKKTGMFNSSVTISSKNDAVQYTDGLWYVWTGALPHTISSGETPDVEITKWACVGLLNGYEICSALNYSNAWGVHDDSPLLRKAILSLIRTGYARFCVNAGVTINLFTECVIPFYLDARAVSFRFHGETAIGSLGRVSEVAVALGIRGLVFEAIQVEIDHLTFRQWTGNSGQKIVSYTSDTVTLSFDPWPDGRSPVIFPFGNTAGDGYIYTKFLEFTTDAGGYFADNVVRNPDGTVTLLNVHAGAPENTIHLATTVNFFQCAANSYPEGSFADDAAMVTLAVAENPFVHNLWILATYRAFAHGLGSGAGPNALMGNIGVWSDIIVDNALYFISNTNVNPDSPQGINNGVFNNIQLSNVRRGIRGRRIYNLVFTNLQHIASANAAFPSATFVAGEIEGVSINGSQFGWTEIDWVTDSRITKLFQCSRLRRTTVTGCMFGRHDSQRSRGAIIDCTGGAIFGLTFTGNTLVTVDENSSESDYGWFSANEFKSSIIASNSIGAGSDLGGSEYLSFRTGTANLDNFYNSYFGQPVRTNAEAGIFDNELASGVNVFDSTTDYRDAGKILNFEDINNAAVWPDNTRNIIPFGGELSPGKTLGLPAPATLISLKRRKVLIDLSTVVFGSQTIGVYNGATLVSTISTPGVYEFLLVGSKYIRIK